MKEPDCKSRSLQKGDRLGIMVVLTKKGEMVKVRCGEEFGIDLDKVSGWTFIKDHSDEQYLTSSLQLLGYPVPTLRVEERILLYTSGEILVVAKAAVGSQVFTKFLNILLSLYEDIDLTADSSSGG